MLRVLSKVHYSIECEPEDIQIEGNAMASGDDAADEKAMKREALHNLEAAEAAAGVMVHKKRKGR